MTRVPTNRGGSSHAFPSGGGRSTGFGPGPGASDDVQRVLDATDLVALIGESVRLKPAGREFKGLCPFHDDKNPSLCVVPHKGFYKCFACGAAGDAIKFVRAYHRMEFREALQFLADRAGIQLTPYRRRHAAAGEGSDDAGGTELSATRIVEVHKVALSFFRTLLRHEKHGAEARRLFAQRGISEAMIERFELGVAPGAAGEAVWDGLVRTLRQRGVPLPVYEGVGLVLARKTGEGYYDRFRRRLIFPIHDELGRPIAFGGRKIDADDEPKYLNSPEHPRFHKSRTLYALHLAKREVQRAKEAVIVEGYTDVIACHQAGIENVVATLGTALTREHAQVLQRLCDRVVLIFDGDEAGQKAADRAVEVFFETSIDVRIAVIPGGHDPAEFLAESDAGGAEAFRALVRDSIDALDFLFAALRRQFDAADSISSRQRVIEAFLTRLGGLGFHRMGPLRRDLVLARLSTITGLDAQTLHRSIPKPRFRPGAARANVDLNNARAAAGAESSILPARLAAESRIIGCLLHSPGLLEGRLDAFDGDCVRDALPADWFQSDARRDLYQRLLDGDTAAFNDPQRAVQAIVASLDDDLSSLAAGLVLDVSRGTEDDEAKVLEQLVEHWRSLRGYVEWNAYHAAPGPDGGSIENRVDGNSGERGGSAAANEIGVNLSDTKSRLTFLRAQGGNPRNYARGLERSRLPSSPSREDKA